MRVDEGKRLFARRGFLFMALVVTAMVLMFASEAYAQTDLTTASIDQQSLKSTKSESATVDVYVIANANGIKYQYNQNGFISRMTASQDDWRFTYKGAKLVKFSSKPAPGAIMVNFNKGSATYDKKGRLKSMKNHGSHGSYDTYSYKYKYDKKNRVASITGKYDLGEVKKNFYYDKKGRLVKRVEYYADIRGVWSGPYISMYAYNSKGYLAKAVTDGSTSTYRYSVGKHGLLKSKIHKYGHGRTVTKYSYKKIKVPKKYAKAVKCQQKLFQGENIDYARPF